MLPVKPACAIPAMRIIVTVAIAASARSSPDSARRGASRTASATYAIPAAYSGHGSAGTAFVNVARNGNAAVAGLPGTGRSARDAARNRCPEPICSGTSQAATTSAPARRPGGRGRDEPEAVADGEDAHLRAQQRRGDHEPERKPAAAAQVRLDRAEHDREEHPLRVAAKRARDEPRG